MVLCGGSELANLDPVTAILMVDLKMLRAWTNGVVPLQFGKVGAPNVGATFDTDNCVRWGVDLIESTQCVAPVTASINLKDLWVLEES